jgi:hypothetical protein
MLREIPETRQIRGEPRRRWFNSAGMDLYVWYDGDGEPLGFQLCYGKPDAERAFTWFRPASFSHMRVDHGAAPGGRHSGTPLLVPDGFVDPSLLGEFERERIELPQELAALVAEKVRAFPGAAV